MDVYLLRGIFLVGEMSNVFGWWVGFSPHAQGFPQRFGGRVGQSTSGGSNKATVKEELFLVRGGMQGA